MASSGHRHRRRRPTERRRHAAPRRLRVESLEERRVLAVVINEIHYNPAVNSSLEEFIELYNTGPAAVDLSGWAFTDGVSYTFAAGQQIPAGGYVVVAQHPPTLLAEFGVTAVGTFTGGLSSDGEHLELRNAQGQLVDEVEYDVSFPWPIASDGNGASMELINPGLDNNLGSSWRPSYTPPMFPGPADPQTPASSGHLNDLVHRWSFNGNLDDSVGGADAVLVDPQGIADFTSTRLDVSANRSFHNSNQSPFTSGTYVDLPNGIISTLGGEATFEWWGTVASQRTWAEIFSFGTSDGGEDQSTSANFEEYIALIPQADGGTVRATHRNGGTVTESFVNGQPLATGVEYQFAVVWDDANNEQRLYVNGVLAGSSELLIDLVDVEDVNNWLGRSQWADPLFDGYHNEFRIYDRALTSSEIADSYADGPDAVATGPIINSFTASDVEILAGQSATLSWNVTNSTSISINQGVGNVTGLNQIIVTPAETTTYTLTATNAEGSSTRSIRITVEHPRATPGMQNLSFAANAAPDIRQVSHTADPTSGATVEVTARVADPQGVASVQLQYQVVLPGQYLPARLPVPVNQLIANGDLRPTANPAYFDPANWTTIAMNDAGAGGDDAAGDAIYTATIAPQAHRTLVRYRIVVTDALGKSATAPYEDDPSLNFAYFVYDGVPEYRNNANQVLADDAALASLPVYHFLTRAEDMSAVNAYSPSQEIPQGLDARSVYNWSGTMVYNGKVYDNITYRLRGANGRYLTDGKRSMRFRFNDGAWFEPIDNEGNPYPEKWKTLTTGKGFDNRQTLTYALNEAMTMQLSNLMGLPAPETHWFQFRVIDSAAEAPDQWRGDFWGINFALEDYDKRFLDAHGMEPGNLYKLINQTNDALRQEDYQAPLAVSDGSDHDYIEYVLNRASTDIQYRVNLQKYFTFRAIAEAVRHYDYWPTANKNMTYYFEPEYTAENDYLGKLWILMWDTDATFGPTWNEGKDVVYDDLFENFNVEYRDSLIRPQYYNILRELRDLIWQPDQLRGMIEELVSNILPLEAADRARWQNAPADAGNFNGLSGAGIVSLANLVEDMLNFAFRGGSWPGGNVGAGGRAAYLDDVLTASGEEALIPVKPTITYVGDPSMAANRLSFQTTAFADPQGAATFGAVQWRIAEVTAVSAGLDPSRTFVDEWTAEWDSGPLTTFSATIDPPSAAVVAGKTYRARVRFQDATGRWGHWSDPLAFTAAAADNLELTKEHLRIVELHYNPTAGMPQFGEDNVDGEEFEFIELINTSATETIDLSNVQLAGGVTFTFAAGTYLAPGERILVVEDEGNFESRYGEGLPVAGEWTGALNNGGEELIVLASDLAVIQQFAYSDEWWNRTDGRGSSLEAIDPAGDYQSAANWRPSAVYNGTPGAAPTAVIDVVVNEIVANPASGGDAIELKNVTGGTIDLSGWWLSDASSNLFKFQIGADTSLPAGDLIVFNESHFNPGGGANLTDFALSSGGEQLLLLAVDAAGKPVRFADVVSFDASLPGVTLGRTPDGAVGYGLFPLAAASLGSANGAHRASPVVIGEVQYHPPAPPAGSLITQSQLEYIELYNGGAVAVDLSGWQIGGDSGFTMPAGTSVAPGKTLLLVSFAPANAALAAEFRSFYGLAANVTLVGPYAAPLGDRGGEVKLLAPTAGDTGPVYYLVDRVTYDDAAPWPAAAAGGGSSLKRLSAAAFGDLAESWIAAAPTPGSVALTGDYDGNGRVDGADFLAWQRNFGRTVTPGTSADGNNDSLVNATDLTVWRDNFGAAATAAPAATAALAESPAGIDAADAPAATLTVSPVTPTVEGRPVRGRYRPDPARNAALEQLYGHRTWRPAQSSSIGARPDSPEPLGGDSTAPAEEPATAEELADLALSGLAAGDGLDG